jgi:hypothetical protein
MQIRDQENEIILHKKSDGRREKRQESGKEEETGKEDLNKN